VVVLEEDLAIKVMEEDLEVHLVVVLEEDLAIKVMEEDLEVHLVVVLEEDLAIKVMEEDLEILLNQVDLEIQEDLAGEEEEGVEVALGEGEADLVVDLMQPLGKIQELVDLEVDLEEEEEEDLGEGWIIQDLEEGLH